MVENLTICIIYCVCFPLIFLCLNLLFANYNFIQADPFLGVVVGLSICCSMIIAAAVGAFTPLILRKLDIDPAIATGPFVTTSVDILGVLLYFMIAGKFLNM